VPSATRIELTTTSYSELTLCFRCRSAVGGSQLAGQLEHSTVPAPGAAAAVDAEQQMQQGTPAPSAMDLEQHQEQQQPTPGPAPAGQLDPFADDPGDWEPTQQELYCTPHAATPRSASGVQPSPGLDGEQQQQYLGETLL
jgi:hypothetical protein